MYYTDMLYFQDDPATLPGNFLVPVGVWVAGESDQAGFVLDVPESSACFDFEICSLLMVLEDGKGAQSSASLQVRQVSRMLFVRN